MINGVGVYRGMVWVTVGVYVLGEMSYLTSAACRNRPRLVQAEHVFIVIWTGEFIPYVK